MMFFGSQYYRPPFPERSCWQRDMENMRKLGFNSIKLWAMWNWIEKDRGIFDFDELDELVDIASRNGLLVIINTIPEGAPFWVYDGNEDGLYTTAGRNKVLPGGPANIPSGGWPGLCMDKLEFAELVANFIEKTAEHFKNNKSIIAIDVWNEPHLEPMYDYRSDMLCYCEHSCNAFREWLKTKYTTLDNLNEKWFRKYTNWDQIMPPPRCGTWVDMMDWRMFWLYNLQKWLRIRVDACRRGAPDIQVQTHVAYSGILGNRLNGGLANELGDEFLLAREVDIFGLTSFPKWLMGKNYIFNHFIHNEMVAEASHGKKFYQVELQGGAGKAGLLGGEVPNARDVYCWNWNTIVAGGKGVIYWQYSPEPAGVESPGFGLTGFKGENTERSFAAGECAKKMNNEIIDKAQRISSTNAIYISRHSDVLFYCSERQEQIYAGSIGGIFKAAYNKSIPIRFIHEDFKEDILTDSIKTLYMPMPLILSNDEVEILYKFVEAGGTLVSEACPGLYDQSGKLEQNSEALKVLFGADHIELQAMPEWGPVQGIWNDTKTAFTGRMYRQVVGIDSNASTLASFADGKPAITEHKIGKGKAILICTYPSYSFLENEDSETEELLTKWFDKGGYNLIKSISVSKFSQCSLAPVIRLLKTDDKYLLVYVNHLIEDVTVKVEFSCPQNIDDSTIYKDNVLTLFLKASDGGFYCWNK